MGGEVTRLITQTLRIIQGQRQEGAPPGVAVLTPPLRPAPQRAAETLVMLLDLGEQAPSRLCREVREATAQAFWSTSGSPIAALRRAVAAANLAVFRHNLRIAPAQRNYGALSCAAWTGDELFMVQGGPASAWMLCGSALEEFPREDLPPLGVGAYVEMRVTYQPIVAGDTLLLTSQERLRGIPAEALWRVLSVGETEGVLDGLEALAAGRDFVALLARWVGEEAVVEPPSRRRRRLTVAPIAPTAPPPLSRPQPAAPLPAPTEPPIVRPVEPPAPVEAEPAPVEPSIPQAWEAVEREEGVIEPLEIPVWERPPVTVRRRVRVGLEGHARPTVRLRGVWASLSNGAHRVGDGMAGAAAGIGSGLRRLFQRTLPGRDRRARARLRPEPRPVPPENPRLMAGMAIGILALVAVLTVIVTLTYSGAARVQQALHQARQEADLARSVGDPAEQHRHWEAVLTAVAGLGENAEGAALQAEAQAALDQLDGVRRVQPVALEDFGGDAAVRRLVVHGTDLFVLNASRQEVVQISLTELDRLPQTVLQAGSELEGQRVAPLVDMAWNTPAGRWTSDRLIILDADYRAWVYDPAWPNHTYPLGLRSPSGGAATALAAFEGRLYLLDPSASQVWRYWPQEGAYPEAAEPYFSTEARPALASAGDMFIDGSVYILFTDGTVSKWHEGGPTLFLVNGVPAPAPRFTAMALDTERAEGPLILADSADERIVILDANGNFRAQLRAAPGVFHDVQAMALDGANRRLFLVAGGRLSRVDLSSPEMQVLWEVRP